MPRNRDFFKRKKDDKRRQRDIKDNQFLSDYLFTELPKDLVTSFSQLFLFQREVRADGIKWRPVRITVEDLFNAELNFWDESNSAAEYLPTEIFDEGSSTTTYASDEIYNEGNSSTTYT